MIFLIWCAFKDKLLFYGMLPLIIVNIALLIHLTKNNLLPLLVVFQIIERIIIGRLIRNADDSGTFSETQILDILAKIGLGGNADSPAALAEIYGIQIPLQYFLLVIFFLQFQSTKYFR